MDYGAYAPLFGRIQSLPEWCHRLTITLFSAPLGISGLAKPPPDSWFVHSHGGVAGLLLFVWEEKPAPLTGRSQVNKSRATGNNPKTKIAIGEISPP